MPPTITIVPLVVLMVGYNVPRNDALVYFCLKKYFPHSRYREDMLQEGFIGLQKAKKEFDPARGFRFSTFAVWKIRGQMATFHRKQQNWIPTISYLDSKLYFEPQADYSLSPLYGRTSDVSSAEYYYLRDLMRVVLDQEQETLVLLRFGLFDGISYSNRECSDLLCVSRETVRRNFNSAVYALVNEYNGA